MGILLAIAQAGSCGYAHFCIAVLTVVLNTGKPEHVASFHSEVFASACKSRTVAAAIKACEKPNLRIAFVVRDRSSKVSWPRRVLLAMGYPHRSILYGHLCVQQ